MLKDQISDVVIHRMPRYYRYLEDLKNEGVILITSKELSEKMNVTSSQIRQDLNHFNGYGQQGIGYNVAYLHSEIGKLLGVDKINHLVWIGSNLIGDAFMGGGDGADAYQIDAVFVIEERDVGREFQDMKAEPLAKLEAYMQDHPVDIAVLTVPGDQAQEITDQLVEFGVKAIWNFSSADLTVPENVSVENVHLLESIESLSCLSSIKKED